MRELILNYYDNKNEKPRDYLGMSSFGYCDLATYFKWKNVLKIDLGPRLKRKFEHAKSTEDIIVDELREAGQIITDRQLELSVGVVKGHAEGIYNNEYLFEIKTAKPAMFKRFVDSQLETFPQYYNQVQWYLGASHFNKCYYLVHNLVTADLCHFIVEFNQNHYNDLLDRSRDILAETPKQSASYRCNYCNYNGICSGQVEPDKWDDVVSLYHGSREFMEML